MSAELLNPTKQGVSALLLAVWVACKQPLKAHGAQVI